jgi:hypothetical protein
VRQAQSAKNSSKARASSGNCSAPRPRTTPTSRKDLAAKTDDPDLQAAARVQLKKLLAADPVLAKELAALLNAAGGTTITQNVTGKGNIVSAGDMQIRDINLNIN